MWLCLGTDILWLCTQRNSMELHLAKAKIQEQATKAWITNNCWGILSMATGTGKSKIFVDQVKRLAKMYEDGVFVIVVPTRKLRDKNWKEEFEKWGALDLWETRVISTCYKSLKKIKNHRILLVGLDECHRMTDSQEIFFEQNDVEKCLAMTASMPDDSSYTSMDKQMLFRNLELKLVFNFTLLQALQQKVVADVDIFVILLSFDNKDAYLKLSKWDRRLVTEQAFYDHISNQIFLKELNGNGNTRHLRNIRAEFMRELRTKTRVVRNLIPHLKGRFVVFCGGKLQCQEVLGENIYHSSSGDSAFNKFVDMEIDLLGAVSAINEGHTLPMVDGVLIAHMTSKLRDFIQRLGRAIRYRDNFKAKCYIPVIQNSIDYDWTMRILTESKLPYKEVKLNADVNKTNTQRTV